MALTVAAEVLGVGRHDLAADNNIGNQERLTLVMTIALPNLGQTSSIYDVMNVLSSKSASTPSQYTKPSLHLTSDDCTLTLDAEIVKPLSQNEKMAILSHPNELWKHCHTGFSEAVSIGSTEGTVDDYVKLLISSVADALKLKLRLEKPYINSKRADHWVVAFGADKKRGWIVGSIENKLPQSEYRQPYVTDKREFLVQIHDQMTEVYNYYGTEPVFGIGSTGREWRFFKLPVATSSSHTLESVDILQLGRVKPALHDFSPLATSMGPVEYDSDGEDDMDIEQEIGEIQEITEKKLLATGVYKWDDQNMLFALGSVLKQMSSSQRTQARVVNESTLKDRLMWHLVRTDKILSWGWAKFSASHLKWKKMLDMSTNGIVVLCMLGLGADGKVLLVANKKGQVAALKMVKIKELAEVEAKNWMELYSELCVRNRWKVRMEMWMGTPCVIMPVLSQFLTKDERLANLSAVRECLQRFSDSGYVHDDVHWRNVKGRDRDSRNAGRDSERGRDSGRGGRYEPYRRDRR
jgi:Family of unknown function (DUF5898)